MHTARCISPVSLVSQCKLVSDWRLKKEKPAPPYGPCAKLFVTFTRIGAYQNVHENQNGARLKLSSDVIKTRPRLKSVKIGWIRGHCMGQWLTVSAQHWPATDHSLSTRLHHSSALAHRWSLAPVCGRSTLGLRVSKRPSTRRRIGWQFVRHAATTTPRFCHTQRLV